MKPPLKCHSRSAFSAPLISWPFVYESASTSLWLCALLMRRRRAASERLTPPPPPPLSLSLSPSRIGLKRTDGPLSPLPTPQWCLAGEYTFISKTLHATFFYGSLRLVSASFTWISALYLFYSWAWCSFVLSFFLANTKLLSGFGCFSTMKDCYYPISLILTFSESLSPPPKIWGLCGEGKAACYGESPFFWLSEVIWKAAARVRQWRRMRERWEDGWRGFI